MGIQRLINLCLYVITTNAFNVRQKFRLSLLKRHYHMKLLLPTQDVADSCWCDRLQRPERNAVYAHLNDWLQSGSVSLRPPLVMRRQKLLSEVMRVAMTGNPQPASNVTVLGRFTADAEFSR